ncbi:sigma 54-interacting transcriptional regulator [Desulfococcaceae bacterium HSG7]|nr:sigma 54-interacting transcriptional regulator [Desulfococcaceae bacterium HSG7]
MKTDITNKRTETFGLFSTSSVAFFRDIVEQACDGIVVLDRSGTIIVFNKAARKIVKKSTDQVIGKPMWKILPSVWKDMQPIFQTGRPQIGRRINIAPNSIIANRTPIFYQDDIVGILSVFQNIADHEKLASELRTYKELHEELNVIINSSYDGIWISDAEGRAVRVNPASERPTGVNAKEAVGRKLQDIVDEGYFDRSVTLEVLKQQTAVTLIQKSKTGLELMVTGNPVFDEKGHIRLVVTNARDLTELKRLQDELEESRALTDKFRSELVHIHQNLDIGSRIVSRSTLMKKVLNTAMKVSQVDSSVLMRGESGVGKSLIAKLIHKASPRCEKPLVQLDCGGIPASLIEAELFGYVKGAFTGARNEGKPGYFELAESGTLFLDEIGDLPLNTQVKLLRFLEDNEVVRVGDTKPRKIDVRIIAATNCDLEKMVEEGRFRKDLFFRLNVVPLTIPPLRKRIDDIPPLIDHFLKLNNRKCSCAKVVSPAMADCMCRYPFPGNVRELANIMERLAVLSPNEIIDVEDLPLHIRQIENQMTCLQPEDNWNLAQAVKQVEAELIIRALGEYGSQREAARYLGIHHTTLSRKAQRYGISVEKTHRILKNAPI